MSLRPKGSALAASAAIALVVGCQVAAGLTGLTVDPEAPSGASSASSSGDASSGSSSSSSSSSSSGSSSSSSSTSSSGGGGFTVGGAAHYLQGAGLVLANGTDRVTVSASGSFTFPTRVDANASYAVTVQTHPANQFCWLAAATGTATANVTSVDVRCSTALRSKTATAAAPTTVSTTYVDVPGLAPITVHVDRTTQALIAFDAPSLSAPGTHAAVFGLVVDTGAPAAEINQTPYEGRPVAAVTSFVTTLTPGDHVVKAVWKAVSATQSVQLDHNAYATELDVILLDSLPSFDRALRTSLSGAVSLGPGNIPANTLPQSLAAPLSITTTSSQPLLAYALVPDVYGDRTIVHLANAGTPIAAAGYSYDNGTRMARSFLPMTLVNANGTLALDAFMLRSPDGSNTTVRGGNGFAGAVEGILFKSGTVTGAQVLTGAPVAQPMSPAFSLLVQGSTTFSSTVTVAHASRALVFFDAMSVRPVPNWPQSVDMAFFVNGVQGPTAHPSAANSISYIAGATNILGLVDLPIGMSTIEIRIRTSEPSSAGATPSLEIQNIEVPGNLASSPERLTHMGVIVLD